MHKNLSLAIISKYFRKWALLMFLIIITVIIAYFRVRIQMDLGAPYDTYDFLANAAEFAGKSIGYTDIRPPFLSFLTSLIFRFQDLSIAPIFIVDAIIDVLGVIGLYFLLKMRFNNLNSFLGSLLYATFYIVLTYVGVGYPDLPSVSISIWAVYLTILAVKDSRFFFLSFPIAMIAFLTMYTQVLLIFPILLFVLMNWQNIKRRRNMLIGIILSFLIIIPLLAFYSRKYGNPISPFLDFYGTSSGSVSEMHFDYNSDLSFYMKILPFAIGNGALLVVLLIISGLLFGWIRLIRGKIAMPMIKDMMTDYYKSRLIIILILTSILVLSFGNVNYLFSEVLFFVLCLFSFKMVKFKDKLDLDFLFISWFITFLIFNSVFQIKDVRYFLNLMPPFAYFLIRGLAIIENQLGLIRNKNLTFYLTPVLVLVIIVSTSFYLMSIPQANEYSKSLNKDMEAASQWLINYDPDYKSKVIFSDLWPHSGWFLQTDVQKMPEFKDNKSYYNSLKEYKPTKEDSIVANNFLIEHNAYYYFNFREGLNLTDYKVLKKFGIVTIYQRI